MDDLFVRLTDAVNHIRNAVESVLNDDDTFTTNDDTSDQYEPCSTVTELTPDPGFPNVRDVKRFTKTKKNKSLVWMTPYYIVVIMTSLLCSWQWTWAKCVW